MSNNDDYDSDGSSVFFGVRKVGDRIGFPDHMILGINKRGVHVLRKEYLHSLAFREIKRYGNSNTGVCFWTEVAGVSDAFEFATEQGEEILAAFKAVVSQLSNKKAAINTEVLDFEADNATLKAQLNRERDEKEAMITRVLDLEAENANLKTQVNREREEKEAVEAENAILKADQLNRVRDVNAGLEALEKQVSDLKLRLMFP